MIRHCQMMDVAIEKGMVHALFLVLDDLELSFEYIVSAVPAFAVVLAWHVNVNCDDPVAAGHK